MLNRFILINIQKNTPSIISQRFRVRHLPQERFSESETPFFSKKPGKALTTDFFAFVNRKDLNWTTFKNWRKWRKFKDMQEDQKYLPERHQILGPNLATAHFICAREGKVKFKGSKKWITNDDLEKGIIPDQHQPGYVIEEIDASETKLCYEGFENLCNLIELKKLNLRNCPYVDDWCLSRSYLFEKSLQHLDISGCENVTERGICALHPLRNLKTLVLHDTPNLHNKELVCLLLQDLIPELEVIGVDFQEPALLEGVEGLSKQ